MAVVTRLSILRILGALHAEPLRYDLNSLRAIIRDLAPDLVCVDITREDWENGDLTKTSLEVRGTLVPVIQQTDSVLVPVAPNPEQFSDYQATSGWRQGFSRRFDVWLKWGQRKANSPEAIHGLAFEAFCHTVCALTEMTWSRADRDAHRKRNEALADNIIQAIRRDPGRRVLVVIQCQWQHTLEPALKKRGKRLDIVDYREL
jgi:hypothetical protein